MHQARRLRRDFGAQMEWRGYELFPDGMELPGTRPEPSKIANRPDTPLRIDLALAAEGIEPLDLRKDGNIRTHSAHEAVEFAKELGVHEPLIERIFHAYWRGGRDIASPEVLAELAQGLIEDIAGLKHSIGERKYAERIVPFNKPAYETGVFNLPTWWIGGERLAEPPYAGLARALKGTAQDAPYETLEFPAAPKGRPYVVHNMVATIDGKTISGSRDETVMDLGSEVDHRAMRNIESAVEAVMIGAKTLRATPKVRFDSRLFRIVVTGSGRLDPTIRFFTEGPDKAVVATPEGVKMILPEGVRHWTFGSDRVDPAPLLERIRDELGVTRLLVEGGSELNAGFLSQDLSDELFLTVAPKLRLGTGLPTYAGGEPLPKGALHDFELISSQTVGDEVFLRYRRKRRP